jgi:hypothetical protein
MLGAAFSPSPRPHAFMLSLFFRMIANQDILFHSATTGAGEAV